MELTHIGRDSHGRPVYESYGQLFVDTNPSKDHPPRICTKYKNAFDGEPDCLVEGEFEFIPRRVTRD